MASPEDIYSGMAVCNGKIVAMFNGDPPFDEYFEYEKLDLNGNVVFPGFIDSHVHLTQTGLNAIGVPLNNVKSIVEMTSAISKSRFAEYFDRIIFGTGYDDTLMKDQKLPSLPALDEIVNDKYLWLSRVDSHSCLVNSKFLEYLNLDADINGIDVDGNGMPTGVLRAEANSIARKAALDLVSDKARRDGITHAIDNAVEMGVTSIHALEGGPLFSDMDFHFIREYSKSSPIHIEPHFQVMDVKAAEKYNLNRLGGCIILDGSFGSRTAALFEPYSDDASSSGTLYIDSDELEKFVVEAAERDIQVAFHALGERAIEQVLNAYQKAYDLFPDKQLRHRIEHFELPLQKHIDKASKMGVIISVQPAFDYHWGGESSLYYERLGQQRALRAIPLKSILDSGCMMIGGSDSDVTSINPLVGIHGAVNHSNKSQAIQVYDAIRMFTYNGAYAIGKENEIGSLEPTKHANFVVLNMDLMNVPSDQIDSVEVLATYCQGEQVYSKA